MCRGVVLGLLFLFLTTSCEEKNKISTPVDLNYHETENSKVDCPEINFVALTIIDLPQEIMKFVPSDYLVLDTIEGLLNDDKFYDFILVLKYKCEGDSKLNGTFPEERPMLVLTGNKAGVYELVKRNDNVIFCYNCGGVMGDPYQGMVIKDRGFVIQHDGGSAWRWQQTVSFDYSKQYNDWYLIENVNEGFHSSEPDYIERKVLTQKDFGLVNFESYNMEG